MPIRTLTLAPLGVLWLAAASALAATTDQQKLEKKVARYAQPIADLDFTKPRALCTCGPGDPISLTGQTGVLAYTYQGGVGTTIPSVTCQIAIFDLEGAAVSTLACDYWRLLSR